MIVGLSTMIFEENKSLDKLQNFNFVKELGLRYIELSDAFNFQQNVLNALKKDNLKVFSIHADYIDSDISSPDENKRKNGINDAIQRINYLNKLNGNLLVIHPGSWYSNKNEEKERIKNCINSLEIIFKKAKLQQFKDIKIAIENLPPEFFGDDIEIIKFILEKTKEVLDLSKNNKVDNKLGICLDSGHGFLANNLYDYLNYLYNDILSMHLHDNYGDKNQDKKEAMDDIHAVPGSGNIDWDKFFNILHNKNYQGGLIFEIKKGTKYESQILIELKNFINNHY